MLKFFLVVSVVLVMAACVGAAAAASTTDWAYSFAIDSGWPYVVVGVKQGSIDGVDGTDILQNGIFVPESTVFGVSSFIGDTAYSEDYRAALLPGETKTWTIKVHLLQSGFEDPPVNGAYLSWGILDQSFLQSDYIVTLRMTQVPWEYEGPTFWDLKAEPLGSIPYLQLHGDPTIATFEFSVTAVPEPSSLIALFGSVGGMLALARRRK